MLFDQSILSQVERWLSRMQSEHSYTRMWMVFSPSTFCNFVNSNKQIPYTPRPATKDIGERLKKIENTIDLNDLEKEYQNIFQYISICRQRYEKGECGYICQCINNSLPKLRAWEFDDTDDVVLYETVIQDIERLLKSTSNWIANY